MNFFKSMEYSKLKLSKLTIILAIIIPFLISYGLYLYEKSFQKTYMSKVIVRSNEDIIQIYKMMPTYQWDGCEKGSADFKKLLSYSVLQIPMQKKVVISVLTNDAKDGEYILRSLIDRANCVYGNLHQNKIKYFENLEFITSLEISRIKKLSNKSSEENTLLLMDSEKNYLLSAQALISMSDIQNYLIQQRIDELEISTMTYRHGFLRYVIIIMLIFLSEFTILMLGLFLSKRNKSVQPKL